MITSNRLQPLAGALQAEMPQALSLGGDDATGDSVGELLRQARDKAGLSVADVAARLRMGVKQVRALEEGDYRSLPSGIFLRGFVRNFAKVVGVKPESALALLEKTHLAAIPVSASSVVVPSQQNISVPTPGGDLATPRTRMVIVVVISLLVFIIVWWWWEYVRPYLSEGGRPKADTVEKAVSVPIAIPEQVPVAAPSEAVAAPPSGIPVVEEAQPAPVQTRAASVPAPPASALAPPETPVAKSANGLKSDVGLNAQTPITAGSGMLGLTFSANSWVHVVDANGKAVLDRSFKSGDAEEVTGKAPFSVVIGNAKATRLAYNGKEIDLAPHTRASVARVTVK